MNSSEMMANKNILWKSNTIIYSNHSVTRHSPTMWNVHQPSVTWWSHTPQYRPKQFPKPMGLFYFNLETLLISHTVWLCKNNKLRSTNCMVTGGSENQYIIDKFSFEDQYNLRISITDCIQLLYQHHCGYFISVQFNYVSINTEVQYSSTGTFDFISTQKELNLQCSNSNIN
jgi:hypothetical protein